MRRDRVAGGLISWREGTAVRDSRIINGPVEQRQGGFGLVEGHFVAGLVDAQEGEVAVLAHFAVFGPVHEERRVARRPEFGCVRVVDL